MGSVGQVVANVSGGLALQPSSRRCSDTGVSPAVCCT